MNDYFLRILARQRHWEILTECNKAARHLQLEPLLVSRRTWVTGIFRHFFRQWRRPIAYPPTAAVDERNRI
jgi:hypothetical protein